MNKQLFDNDSGSGDDEVKLGTNKEYAKSYNTFRQKELLKKLKDQDGSDSDSDSDSSDDEDVHNPIFDEAFYKTLASLKQKDPRIYDKNETFFDESLENGEQVVKEKKAKALTIKDYEHKVLVEKGGIYEDDEDAGGDDDERPHSPTYVQEQESIRKEFRTVLEDDSDEEDEKWGGIFQKREKTTEEKLKEDEEDEKWLADPKNAIETLQNLKPLKEFWSNPKLPKDELFLRDYVLTNGYANTDVDEIPKYSDIIAESEEDEEFNEKQTEFEHKFNFRYEEPDKDFIKRYPRTIEQSVRKTDDRRKEKRVEVRERKQKEKQEKLQEIEILKDMKRKEIEDKIAKLKAVTGDEELAFGENDLEEDFDPEAHDKRMQELFNSEYYEVDEGEDKPDVPSDIEDLQVDNYDEYDPDEARRSNGQHCEDDDFNMDCDYDPVAEKKSFQQELIENTRDKRKRRKRKSKFMEMLETEKPKFNPDDEKTYGQYLDEYYKLDCEDIIGDTPCRFKYVETTPNDFGLSIDEILFAKNKELNAWASMKKTTQIRPEHVDRNEQEMFRRKSRNDALKKKILCSLYELSDEELEPDVVTITNPQIITIEEEKISKNSQRKQKKQASSTVVSGALKAEEIKLAVEVKKEEKPSTSKLPETEQELVVKEEATNDDSTVIKEENKPLKRKLDDASSIAPNNVKKKKVNQPQSKKQNNNTQQTSKSNSPAGNAANRKGQHQVKKFQKPAEKGKIKTNGLSDERLKAFGINPKKFQKQLKYGKQTQAKGATSGQGGAASKPFQQKQNKGKLQNKNVNAAAHKKKLQQFLNKSK